MPIGQCQHRCTAGRNCGGCGCPGCGYAVPTPEHTEVVPLVTAQAITVRVSLAIEMSDAQATAWARLNDMTAPVRAKAIVDDVQALAVDTVQATLDRYATVTLARR